MSMKLIHVTPISRGIVKESLSYFTSAPSHPGSIISVPLRGRSVPALIIDSEEVTDAKAKIRGAGYQIKKVSTRKEIRLFLPSYIRAATDTALYSASTTGSTLYAALPTAILADPKHLIEADFEAIPDTRVASEKLVLQADQEERLTHYKNIVREEFARRSSVFICVPTIRDTELLIGNITKGIEQYTFVLHSSLTKKEIRDRWNNALKSKHSILVIATGTFLCLPRDDIGTIIIEKEHSTAYKTQIRPFLDFRILAEKLAHEQHIRVIYADFPLRIETLWRYRRGELDDINPLKVRAITQAPMEIIDMRAKERSKNVIILGDKLTAFIKEATLSNKQIFLYTARRGLSPITVCEDCGSTVMSEDMTTPMVLHKSPSGNMFVCHKTGEVRNAHERCRVCESWRLKPLGIGIERVAEEIRKEFPDVPVFTIDRDSVKTHKKAHAVMEEFTATTPSILLGTEMALPYITEVSRSAVVSIDSLLSLPEWNIHEKVFSILLQIEQKTTERVLVQTRKPELSVLINAAKGGIAEFYRDEISYREKFDYPPFTILIKVTTEGTKARVVKEMEEIKEQLKNHELNVYSSLVKTTRNTFALHGLIKVKKEVWPDKTLLTFLRSLPPNITVTVNPERLL